MSATIWVSTDEEKTIDLGNTIEFLKAFDEIVETDGKDFATNYPALAGVREMTMVTDDAQEEWLRAVRRESVAFLQEHRSTLSEHAIWVLETLIGK